MDRVLKVINILLLVIVGMLLLTCVMALIQGSKVDLGKVADWWAGLSALATVGTFAVAYTVYKKAPNWLGQKKDEDVYILVKKLVIEDYYAALKFYQKSIIGLTVAQNNVLTNTYTNKNLGINHTFIADAFVIDNITNTLKLIRKLGYKLTHEINILHENYCSKLIESTNAYIRTWEHYNKLMEYNENSASVKSNAAEIKRIREMFDNDFIKATNHYAKIKHAHDQLQNHEGLIMDYVIKMSKAKH